jgi:hypothetical protein
VKRRVFLITPLLAGCTIVIDRNDDSNMDPSLGGVTTLSAEGMDSEGNEDATSRSTGSEGSCDYECDGVACNFTCMGDSILHEISHNIGTNDKKLGGEKMYGDSNNQRLATKKPGRASRNADNYANFAEDFTP